MIGRATRALAMAGVLGTAALPAAAQSVDRANGEAGAPILQLTTVPRAAALGDALTAADGLWSVFANPAGAATIKRFGAVVSGQTLADGMGAGAVAVGFSHRLLSLAVSVRYLDLGSVDEIVCNGCGGQGTPTGRTLSANEQTFELTGAVRMGRTGVGAAASYYSTSVAEQSGSSVTFSVGVRTMLADYLTIGGSAQFVGGSVTLDGFESPLPQTLRVGAEIRPLARTAGRLHIVFATDYVAVRGAPARVGGGAEFGVAEPAEKILAVARLGFASRGGDEHNQPVRLGAGLRVGQFSLDYSYQHSNPLAGENRIGVMVNW